MTRHHGRFTWHELVAADPDRARAFYPEVFNWSVEDVQMPSGPYAMLKAGETAIGGLMRPPAEGIPPHWVGYVSVASVDATAARIVEAGGKALMDAVDVPTVGRVQPVTDPGGAVFCLFQAEGDDPDPAEGPGSMHWNELWASDADAALKFYRDTFGYSHSSMDMPQGPYHVLEQDGTPVAGIVTSPRKDVPPMWLQYVTVDDVDAAVSRVKRSGGTLVSDPMEVENVGRFGILQDPVGAVIGFITPAPRD